MASSEQLRLVIDVVNKNAIKGMGDLKKAAKGVSDELDDTRSAAKRVADELDRRADEMAADLKASEKAAEALGAALGPELAAKIGSAKLDSFIGDLKRAGLTFEEVEADAESFAQSLRKMDAAADGVKDVDKAMARVGETTDNTRSVVANFAGNAAQELPGVAAAMGPMNMAIGQFAEYAAEGNISLKNFIAASGGLVAAGAVLKLISDRMANVAKIDAFKEESVEGYADALKDARGEVEAIQKALEAAGKVEFIFGDGDPSAWTGGISVVGDATKALQLLGLNAQQSARLINGGEEAIQAWGASLIEAGASQDLVNAGMDALTQQADFFAQAVDNAAVNTAYFSTEVKGAGDWAEYYRSRVEDATEQGELFAGSADRQREAFRKATEKVEDMRDAVDELYGIERDAIQRQDDLADSLANLNDVMSDGKASMDSQYDAAIEASKGYAILNGASLNSKEGVLRQIESLQGFAAALDPKSPLRKALEQYIGQLAAIPKKIDTMLALNITQGATTTKSGDIIGTRAIPGKSTNRASGGQVREGVAYEWNEQGREMFVPNTNGVVVPHGALAAGGGGGAGMVVNIYPRTMPTERELIDLVNGIRRKQGQVI
jgi:uncharacterized coiled-coil DUF342 family protein